MEFWLICQALVFSGLMFSVVMVNCKIPPISLRGTLDSSPFPPNFLFGTASSSYQFEGAYVSYGKGLNNWDIFTHHPGNIVDGSTGDIAVDHYHRYLEDIDLMDNIGVNSFRFSISWARILPKGRFGKENAAGIGHYNRVINALLRKGIQPFVTLTHYDIPQELENRYQAWLSPQVQEDFEHYANTCFKYFGDRVKFWTTFNEPNVVAIQGYRTGVYPPSRCSGSFGNCSRGDSGREPFIAAHNMILSHAAAVRVYRTAYQKEQNGSIGIVLNGIWYEPISNSWEDKLAAERAQAFYMNWFLEPIIAGKYPAEMQNILRSDLPVFSNNELKMLQNGLDFIGVNHYSSFYIKDCLFASCEQGPGASRTEGFALRTPLKDGLLIGEPTAVNWLYVYPRGMENILTYLKGRYKNIPIYITENGFGENETNNSNPEALRSDIKRLDYINSYLDAVETAVRKGADVRGYFVWSLLDNFEWTSGYSIRFGLCHVDYSSLNRTQRVSAGWYKEYIASHRALATVT